MTKGATYYLIWAIYLCLLAVLLPHTAWLFGSFEPAGWLGWATGWAGAIAFEASIAVLTHKLAQRWDAAPVKTERWKASPWARARYWYANVYLAGLGVSVVISALANLAHAVEYGKTLAIFTQWGISPALYQISFGAVLPVTSLLFASVLSQVSETEDAANPEAERAMSALASARADIAEARKAARESDAQRRIAEAERTRAEQERDQADQRFAAVGDLLAALMTSDKRQRLLMVRNVAPKLLPDGDLNLTLLAMIAGVSQSYASEVVKESEDVEP